MSHVVVIGCGVVGAAIAYELSQVPQLKVTVIDRQPPVQGVTRAALGVLMGIISHKVKGKAWQLRLASMQRYESLIPELETLTDRQIPFNRQGILKLCFAGENMAKWEDLVSLRRREGLHLQILDADRVRSSYPYLGELHQLVGAVYSPQDRQVEPVTLTQALVAAAESNGVSFHFGVTVERYEVCITSEHQRLCRKIQTQSLETNHESSLLQDVDWLVISAGLGSLESLQGIQAGMNAHEQGPNLKIKPQLDIRPVLGQALHLRLGHPLAGWENQPVITGDDVHIVPCVGGVGPVTDYWVGATVEFPTHEDEIVPNPRELELVLERAIAFCPELAHATLVRKWSGLRPRPEGQPAPVIGPLQGYKNVLLATGHYRNGVLLAPATAQIIRDTIMSSASV